MTIIRRAFTATAVLFIALVVSSVRVRSDDPVSSNIRFTGDIVRIFDRKCRSCHSADGLAMPLASYRDVRAWGRAIREEIVEQRMPPWTAARGYGRFQNALALTAREATTILSWLDGGMPRGDDRDLPAPSPSSAAPPADVHLTIPPQRVPALEDHVVRRISVDTNLDGARSVARIVVNPGTRRVLRGALVFVGDGERAGQWVGAWLPWQHHVEPPVSRAFRLPPRARLTLELHYRGGDEDVTDQPSIDLYFAADAPRGVGDLTIQTETNLRIPGATTVWAILPAGDESTTSLQLTARRPNGSVDVLLWMPEFRREWPQALVLLDPLTLPAGTTLSLVTSPAASTGRARLALTNGG